MGGNIKQEFQKIKMFFEVKGKTDERRRDFDRVFLKGEIDFCKAAQGIIGNFITKLLIAKLSSYSNYRFSCPQTKGFFFAENFPLPTDNDLPVFLLPFRGKFLVEAKAKAKILDQKFFVHLLSFDLYGDHI